MKTNDLKRGARVVLTNGWEADIMDNMKGNTRLARVYGFETEIGSVYSHNIESVIIAGEKFPIEHTKEQDKLREQLTNLFG
jgi:hypothetical protein